MPLPRSSNHCSIDTPDPRHSTGILHGPAQVVQASLEMLRRPEEEAGAPPLPPLPSAPPLVVEVRGLRSYGTLTERVSVSTRQLPGTQACNRCLPIRTVAIPFHLDTQPPARIGCRGGAFTTGF